MKIIVNVEAIPEQRVSVMNYNRNPAVWENGVVMATSIGVGYDGTTWTRYHVALDRRSKKGNLLFVTVGCDKIKLITRRQ